MSEESKRIAGASSAWQNKQKPKKRPAPVSDASSEPDIASSAGSDSSLSGFARWVFDNAVTSDELTLLQKLHNRHSLQLGEFCAGMATGTLVSSVLETCLQQQGLDLHLSVNLMSEMIEWKREVCADMHRNVMRGQSPQLELVSRTADLAAQRPVKTCNIAVAAIECDDVSSCSTTPRSILDRGGRSGSSFLEFIDWVTAVPHQARPSFILMECVSGLGRLRRSVGGEGGERGTSVATARLEEAGYVGEWKLLNSCNFDLPQSRTRYYGIFVRLSSGLGPEARVRHLSQVELCWQFVKRCEAVPRKPLASLLAKSDLQDATLSSSRVSRSLSSQML